LKASYGAKFAFERVRGSGIEITLFIRNILPASFFPLIQLRLDQWLGLGARKSVRRAFLRQCLAELRRLIQSRPSVGNIQACESEQVALLFSLFLAASCDHHRL